MGVFIYGKECTFILDKVQTTIKVKDLSKLKYLKVGDSGKGLSVLR